MRLTEPQRQHLHELNISADRPQPETAALVNRQLAEQGKGRFGEWVRITSKGRDHLKTFMPADPGKQGLPHSQPCDSAVADQPAPLSVPRPAATMTADNTPSPTVEGALTATTGQPNAVRVLIRNRYAYYPIDHFEKLDAPKVLVRTKEQLFSSHAVEASEDLDIIFPDPPKGAGHKRPRNG